MRPRYLVKKNDAHRFAIKTDFLLGIGLTFILVSGQLTGCGNEPIEEYEIQQNSYTGKIRVNLSHVQSSGKLLVAAPPEATQLVCKIGQNPCNPASENPQLLKSVSKPGGPQFFVVTLAQTLASDLTMRFAAVDQGGKIIDQRGVKYTKGGPGAPTSPAQPGAPTQPGTPTQPGSGGNSAGSANQGLKPPGA